MKLITIYFQANHLFQANYPQNYFPDILLYAWNNRIIPILLDSKKDNIYDDMQKLHLLF